VADATDPNEMLTTFMERHRGCSHNYEGSK